MIKYAGQCDREALVTITEVTIHQIPSKAPPDWVEWGAIYSDVCLRARDAANLRAQASCVELGEKRKEGMVGEYESFDVEFAKLKAQRRMDLETRVKEREKHAT